MHVHALAPQPWCELDASYVPQEFRIQWASDPWMIDCARQLRRQVFCAEQRLFDTDDTDRIDRDNPSTRLLVASSCCAGQPDEVLGTVRIHEQEPGIWWGSRLAVRREWRNHVGLGTTLIRLAVCSAHALGCREFNAHVQQQNVALFERLHWTSLHEETLFGHPHHRMQADLAHYPRCDTPCTGYVLASGGARQQ